MIKMTKWTIRACLILLCLFGARVAYAQWTLDIKGTVISQNDKSKLAGAKITVLKNGSRSNQVIADIKGKFAISLASDAKFMLEFSYSGYVTKRISFDTRFVPPEASAEGNFPFSFDMTLFKEAEGLDVSILNKPLAEVKFDPKIFDFNYDKEYTKSIKIQIEKLQADLEANQAAAAAAAILLTKNYNSAMADGNKAMMKEDYLIAVGHFESALVAKPGDKAATDKIAEARKKQEEFQAEKATEKAYTEAIERAEKAMHDNNLKEAETEFKKALEVKPQDTYAKDQLSEVQGMIVALAKAEQAYITAIGKADEALKAKDYLTAKGEYIKASEAKPNEPYPKGQLKEVESLIMADAQKESDYIKAVERGEISMENKDYEAAKAAFELASEVKPGENYPKEQLAKIVALMGAIELSNKNYAAAIKKGDDLLNKNDFENAKTAYIEAVDIKPNEQYPKDQIVAIDAQLADMEKTNALYDELIADADTRFETHDYVAAKSEYQKALDLKPNEKHPTDRIAEISHILVELAKSEEDYKHAISNGDNAFNGKDYNSAKFEYETASKIKPNETYPQEQLAKIDVLLADLAQKDEEYKNAIADADGKFNSNDFENAKESYVLASSIKPEEQYPKEQLKLIDEKLIELGNLNKAYDQAISEADQLFGNEKYEDAKEKFQSALDMKPSEAYPKEKIAEITSLIAGLQKKEAEYQKLISEGDAAFDNKSYETALSAFSSAGELKPEESYPKGKIVEINKLITELAEVQKKYDETIAKADNSYNNNDLNAALPLYKEAAGVKPDESYPNDQIALIEGKMGELAKQEEAYQAAISEAESAEKANKLTAALSGYKTAAGIKPEESLPKEKIAALTLLIADLAEQDKSYNEAISLADVAKKNEEYDIAITQYKAALDIKPNEQYPKDQIKEVDQLKVAALAAIALINKQNEDYKVLIEEADAFFTAKKYEDSKEKYKEAIGVKPEESYPKNRIAEIDKLTNDLAEQQAIDSEFASLVATADAAFKSEDWETAKTNYKKALDVKPAETYPSDQLKAIDAAIAAAAALAMKLENEQAAREREEKYAALVASGDAAFKSEDWETAKSDYNEAKTVKPAETYPSDQLKAIDAAIAAAAALAMKLENEQAAREREEKYAALISSADKAFDSEDWETAKADYNKAKGVKPDESYPDEQLRAIDEAIAAAEALAIQRAKEASAQERDAQYAAFIVSADKAFDSEDWEVAKDSYRQAQAVKPEETYPKEQLQAIDQAIAAAAALAAKQAKENESKEKDELYADLIASADQSFRAEEWDQAKSDYKEALSVKPSETYPSDQLKAIEEAILAAEALAAKQAKENAAKEKEEAYASIIMAADRYFNNKDWDQAKSNYQEALEIKSGESYPLDQIAKIEEAILASKALDLREQYDAFISTADRSFRSEDWESARSNYNSALSVFPKEQYPKDQIIRIDKAEEDAASIAVKNKTDEEYRQLIGDADQLFAAADYSASRNKYKEALGVKPTEIYPKNRIDEIDEKLTSLDASNKSMDEKYNGFIDRADKAMEQEDYKTAISNYESALSVKSGESYPKRQIDKIKQLLKGIEEDQDKERALAQKQKEYDQIIVKADSRFSQKDYQAAKGNYERALDIMPSEAYPQKKISEIEDILASLAVVAPKPVIMKSSSGMSDEKIAAMMAAWQLERDQSKVDQMDQYKKDLKEVSDERVETADERRLETTDDLVELESDIKESNRSGENRNLEEALLVDEFKEDQELLNKDLTQNSENKRNNLYTDLEQTEMGQKEMKDQGNVLYTINTEKMTTEKIELQGYQQKERKKESQKIEKTYAGVVDLEEGIKEDHENNHERYMKDVEKINKENADVTATINNWDDESRENRGDAYTEIVELESDIRVFNADNKESYKHNTEEYWNTVESLSDYYDDKNKQSKEHRKKAYGDIKDYSSDVALVSQERNNKYDEHNKAILKDQMAISDYHSGMSADADERRLNFDGNFYTGEEKPRYPEKARQYRQGVTEESYQEDDAYVIKRIVVTGEDYNEYVKIFYKWGGIFYKKNGEEITEVIWNTETR